jgi:hypothetical protein
MTHLIALMGSYIVLCASMCAAQAPSAEATATAWGQVRQWIDDGSVPGHGHTTPEGVEGVAVLLWWQGHLIGADSAFAAAGDIDPLAKAARGALAAALADHRLSKEALPPELRASALSRLAVEVEVAGPFQPLNGPTELLHEDLHPSLHGLGIRRGADWSIRLPSRMRAAGQAATPPTMQGMLFVHGVNVSEADAMRRTGELTLYRVETLNLRQLSHDAAPFLFERGRHAMAPAIETKDDLRALVDRLATGLLSAWIELKTDEARADSTKEPKWFLGGTFDPHRDAWTPANRPERDLALAALSLARLARHRPAEGVAHQAALSMLETLRNAGNLFSATAALSLLAADALQVEPPSQWLTAARTAVVEDDGPARAMAVLALVNRPTDKAIVRDALRQWSSDGARALLETLPWSLLVADLAQDNTLDPLFDLSREVLLARQLGADGGPWGMEASGTVALRNHPDAMGMASLRAGWSLAALIAHAPPVERNALRSRALLLATALQRRTISDAQAALWASPDTVRNRVALALWDERLPVSAQAIALMTAIDLAEALDDMKDVTE